MILPVPTGSCSHPKRRIPAGAGTEREIAWLNPFRRLAKHWENLNRNAPDIAHPNIAVLVGLAWLVIVVQLVAVNWAQTAHTLLDTDDAMRLVQMREFLAGRGWFDLHEMRLGPPAGYDTHWSRLIDAGLAGLFLLFDRFTDTATAERLVRTVWPMLWLIPAIAGATLLAWRIAGRAAAPLALLCTVLGLPAYAQFVPGRIDHHNVQIALAVLLVAAVAWSDRARFAAAAAGGLTGAAMAIGFESVPYVVLAGAAMALRFVASRDGARPLALYGVCAAIAVAIAFLINVSPAHWNGAACDAIAINSTAAVMIATGGLALIGRQMADGAGGITQFAGPSCVVRAASSDGWPARAVAVIAVAAAAGAAFLAIEPQCLHGPFTSDPVLSAIWTSHVSEAQPLWAVAWDSPVKGAAIAAFPAVALLCMLALARDPRLRGDFGFAVAAVALAVAAVVTTIMVRAFFYAEWLAIPIAAAGAVRLAAALRLGTVLARFLVASLLTPAATSTIAVVAVRAMTGEDVATEDSRLAAGCWRSDNYALLAALPPGLVATDIDYGSYVLALTPHAVVSAPYYRVLSGGPPIVAAHRIFALPPDAAREVVNEVKPDYLVVCGRHSLGGLSDPERAASLWGRLQAGEVPAWLEVVAETRDQPLKVYRVKP